MLYPVSCTAVCSYVKKVGVVSPNFGGPDPRRPTPQWLRPWSLLMSSYVPESDFGVNANEISRVWIEDRCCEGD